MAAECGTLPDEPRSTYYNIQIIEVDINVNVNQLPVEKQHMLVRYVMMHGSWFEIV